MNQRRLVTVLVAIVMVLTVMPLGVFAQEGQVFSDMPNNWSTAALEKAVGNGLLKGSKDGDKLLINPNSPIKRAELAAVVNRAFGAVKKGNMSGVQDVSSSAWYADDMAKAVAMGTFMKDTKMRPEDGITRQEAFTVLARAFKVTSKGGAGLSVFSDAGKVAAWAKDSLAAMTNAGYIQGSGGKLNPTANISRAEFAVVMDNLVKQYVVGAGEVKDAVASGNLLVRSAGATLKDITINGDLIIADGVGEGDVILDNVVVKGRTVIRGGGVNSIIIKGNSDVGTVVVYKVDGQVRVKVEGGADVEVIYIEDGSDDVIVEGKVGTLEVGGDTKVTANNATVESLVLSGDGSEAVLGSGTTVQNAEIKGDGADLTTKSGSTVKNVEMTGSNAGIKTESGSTIDKVEVSGSNATVEGNGTVTTVNVEEGTAGAAVTTPGTTVTGPADTTPPPSGGTGGGTTTYTFAVTLSVDGGAAQNLATIAKTSNTLGDQLRGAMDAAAAYNFNDANMNAYLAKLNSKSFYVLGGVKTLADVRGAGTWNTLTANVPGTVPAGAATNPVDADHIREYVKSLKDLKFSDLTTAITAGVGVGGAFEGWACNINKGTLADDQVIGDISFQTIRTNPITISITFKETATTARTLTLVIKQL